MKNKFRAWLLVILIATVVFVLRVQILSALGWYLVQAGEPVKADAILVLAGDSWGHRILRGAELVRQGYAPLVLVSGPDGAYGNHECDLAIPFAVKRGYPESYFVHAENQARSTVDEAQAMAVDIRKRQMHKILLVTSNYHTRRSGEIFRRLAKDIEVVVVAAPDQYFTPDTWWKSRQGQKTFFTEWEKTIANWFGI